MASIGSLNVARPEQLLVFSAIGVYTKLIVVAIIIMIVVVITVFEIAPLCAR